MMPFCVGVTAAEGVGEAVPLGELTPGDDVLDDVADPDVGTPDVGFPPVALSHPASSTPTRRMPVPSCMAFIGLQATQPMNAWGDGAPGRSADAIAGSQYPI
jgi:hypothetical protein